MVYAIHGARGFLLTLETGCIAAAGASNLDGPQMRLVRQTKVGNGMKRWVWMIGGICAGAAGWMVWGPKRVEPVRKLAHQLEEAWPDQPVNS